MGSGGSSGGGLGVKFPTNPSQLKHMFANREGHVPDTPANRRLILDTVNNRSNYRGTDQWGLDSYSQKLSDGRQVWARVNREVIDDAGINTTERPWDDITGFNRNPGKE